MEQIVNWPEVEKRLRDLPRWAISSFAVRSARRYYAIIWECESRYGIEVIEWLLATDACLRMVELYAAQERVSRFTLDLASELARAAATAAANATQALGPSAESHNAELAFAAAALAADSARTPNHTRAAACAMQAARAVCNGEAISPEQLEDLRALQQGEPLDKLWGNTIPQQVLVVEAVLREYRSPLFAPRTD
jgi:hypothetical protein